MRVYMDSDEFAHSELTISAKKKKPKSIMGNILLFAICETQRDALG